MIVKRKKFVVLSYGRSGSVLLTQHLKEKMGRDWYFVESIENLLPDKKIQHSHCLFPFDVFKDSVKIFSLRSDPSATILSFVLADHFKFYHKHQPAIIKNQTIPQLTPFKFENWEFIDRLCNCYVDYHCYYQNYIDSKDYVVFYEELINRLDTLADRWSLMTYSNKQDLLINYKQVLRYINNNYLSSMIRSHRCFIQHHNPTNIYEFLSNGVYSA